MVKMPCQSCAKVLRFPEKYLGRKIHCPQCGHPQVLADAAQATHASPRPERSLREAVPSYPTAAAGHLGLETNALGSDPKNTLNVNALFAPAESDDELGRLGGYRILKQLGAGGMGVVFLAEDPSLHRQIAVKVLPPGLVADGTARDRFYREARAAARLEHENIISIHQIGEDRGVVFLAMPLLKGRPLDQYFADRDRRPLPIPEIVRIGRQIAAGLAEAHEHGLVHRDIKPANIWLEQVSSRDGAGAPFRVKILDFGLARSSRDSAALTQTGIIVGTPSYMSPEQARGPNVDGRSDLFSLGAVLYELATGRRPFQGSDAMSVLSSLASDIPLPPTEIDDDVPNELSDLIMDLLEKDPGHRPPTARDVEERLASLDTASGSRNHQEHVQIGPTRRLRETSRVASPRRKSTGPAIDPLWLWLGAGGGVAVVGALSLALFVVLSEAPRPPDKGPGRFNAAKKGVPNDAPDVVERPPPPPPPHPEFHLPPLPPGQDPVGWEKGWQKLQAQGVRPEQFERGHPPHFDADGNLLPPLFKKKKKDDF